MVKVRKDPEKLSEYVLQNDLDVWAKRHILFSWKKCLVIEFVGDPAQNIVNVVFGR